MTTTNTIFLCLYVMASCATLVLIAIGHKAYRLPFSYKQIKLWLWSIAALLVGGYSLMYLRTLFVCMGCLMFSIVWLAILLSKTYLRDSSLTVLGQIVTSFVFWPGFLIIGLYLTVNSHLIDEFDEDNS